MQRAHGVRRLSKHGQRRQSRALCAAARLRSVDAGIAKRVCRRHGASMASARSQPRAKPSQYKARRATIRVAAPPSRPHGARPSRRGIAAIAAGRASIPASMMRPGLSARSHRSSMPLRSRRSRRRRACRSQPARASGLVRGCRIQGTGRHCESSGVVDARFAGRA
jgi:hypothetical protein